MFICRYLDLFTRYVSLCAPRAAAYALSVISVVEGSMHKSQSLPCSLARYAPVRLERLPAHRRPRSARRAPAPSTHGARGGGRSGTTR